MAEIKEMIDSGLGTGTSDVSTSVASSSKPSALAHIKRPVSMIGLRRPMSDFEKESLSKLRQRSRSNHSFGFMNLEKAPDVFMPEEVLRFYGENILTFSQLEYYPKHVQDYESAQTSVSIRGAGDFPVPENGPETIFP